MSSSWETETDTSAQSPDLQVRRDTPPDVSDLSLGELVGRVTTDVTRLFRAELQLAKTEIKEEVQTAGKGAGMLTGAGLAGWLAVLFLSLTAMFALGAVMHLAWAALIVTAVWAIVAGVLAASGRTALKQVKPGIPQTVETLKEDAQWVKRPHG